MKDKVEEIFHSNMDKEKDKKNEWLQHGKTLEYDQETTT